LRKAQSGRMNAESDKNRLLQEYAYSAMKARMISAFAQMHKVDELVRIAQEQKKLLKTQRQSLKGGVAANRAGVSAVSMTDAETAETEIMLAELDEEKHEIEAMLTNMLGYVPKTPDTPDIEMTAWNGNVDNTYPVLAAAADITMADKDVDIRKAQYGPNFEIQASAGRMDGGDQGGTIMLGVSVPLWSSGNQAPKLRGAKAALAAVKLDQDTIRRNLAQKLVHLQAQIDTSTKKIELSRKKETLLKEAAKAASREYEAGKGEFVMILKTRREAFAAQAQTMAEKARHATLVAELNQYIRKEN
jgi:outer membrane protein TolC